MCICISLFLISYFLCSSFTDTQLSEIYSKFVCVHVILSKKISIDAQYHMKSFVFILQASILVQKIQCLLKGMWQWTLSGVLACMIASVLP